MEIAEMHDDLAHWRELATDCLRLLGDGAVPPPPVTAFRFADYDAIATRRQTTVREADLRGRDLFRHRHKSVAPGT